MPASQVGSVWSSGHADVEVPGGGVWGAGAGSGPGPAPLPASLSGSFSVADVLEKKPCE